MSILSRINSPAISRLTSKLPFGSVGNDQPRLSVAVRGGQLRLAIAEQERIVWRRVTPLSPAYIEGGLVAQPRAVAAALRTALEQSPYPTIAEGVAAVAGFHALASVVDVPTSREHGRRILSRERRAACLGTVRKYPASAGGQ